MNYTCLVIVQFELNFVGGQKRKGVKMNNSICPTCKNRFNCPARDVDIICDDLTGYVVECEVYDYSEQTEGYI